MGNSGPEGAAVVAPALGREYDADSRNVVAFLARAEQALDALPPKGGRDERQARLAQQTANAARRARRCFVEAHAERIYAELTDDRRVSLRLPDLAGQAAELWPGLAPTKERLERERALAQRDKEGWEIDQGILFWGLLRSVTAGRHLLEAMRRPTPEALAALAAFRATGRADLGVVRVRRTGETAEVTVDNHRFLNAEDDGLVRALEIAVDLVLLDPAVRVGMLRGAPMRHPRHAGRRVFSAGINLTRLYRGEISLVDFFLTRELGYISKIFRGLSTAEEADDWLGESVEKPWVAAVDAFAIGGGAQLLLVFDRVIVERGGWFSLPALREGIIPGAANLRLPRTVGNRLSRHMVFADRRIEAASPEGRLLCDDVVEPERMGDAVAAASEELANPAVVSNRRVLHRHEEPDDLFRGYMAAYALEQSRRLYSDDLVTNLERTWIARQR